MKKPDNYPKDWMEADLKMKTLSYSAFDKTLEDFIKKFEDKSFDKKFDEAKESSVVFAGSKIPLLKWEKDPQVSGRWIVTETGGKDAVDVQESSLGEMVISVQWFAPSSEKWKKDWVDRRRTYALTGLKNIRAAVNRVWDQAPDNEIKAEDSDSAEGLEVVGVGAESTFDENGWGCEVLVVTPLTTKSKHPYQGSFTVRVYSLMLDKQSSTRRKVENRFITREEQKIEHESVQLWLRPDEAVLQGWIKES